MLCTLLDMRTSSSRWDALLRLPWAGVVHRPRPIARFIVGFTCPACGADYLAAMPVALPQKCPACGSTLERRVGVWDIMWETRPSWMSDTEVPG